MRCQWCGNSNPAGTAVCNHCQKDLVADQTVWESVEALESLQVPEPDVTCPKCGASNFIGSRFCDMCDTPLHPGAHWPVKKISAPQKVVQIPAFARALAAVPAVLIGVWILTILLAIGMFAWEVYNPSPRMVVNQPTAAPQNTVTFEGHNDPLPPVPVKIDVDGKDSPAPRAGKPRPRSTASVAAKPEQTSFLLPLPKGSSVTYRDEGMLGGLKHGVYKCQLGGSVYDNQRYFDSSAMWKHMSSQNMRFAGGSYSWPSGKGEEAMTSASLFIKSRKNDAYSIDISLESMRERPPLMTLLVVQYCFPPTWTLDVK